MEHKGKLVAQYVTEALDKNQSPQSAVINLLNIIKNQRWNAEARADAIASIGIIGRTHRHLIPDIKQTLREVEQQSPPALVERMIEPALDEMKRPPPTITPEQGADEITNQFFDDFPLQPRAI